MESRPDGDGLSSKTGIEMARRLGYEHQGPENPTTRPNPIHASLRDNDRQGACESFNVARGL